LAGRFTALSSSSSDAKRATDRTIEFEFYRQGRNTADMASSREYLDFILEQLSGLERIAYRAMMGEFILYYRGKIVGGIYDDRFLVKPTKSALERMPDADREIPYEGAREMLLVDNVDNREFLTELLTSMYDELPEPKKKK
jgi:TfoX/Sxy family transcriptional regulator of competence genes